MASMPFRRRSLFAALPLLALATDPAAAWAQGETPRVVFAPEYGSQAGLVNLLGRVRHDPAQAGPLLLVSGPRGHVSARADVETAVRASLDSFAEALDRRAVALGGLTVLAPRTMQVFNDRPGKPDPYAGLPPQETARALLGQLTEEQWRLAGSDKGLGLEDLDEAQRPLLRALLPARPVTLSAGLPPTAPAAEEVPPEQLRLRLTRKVQVGYLRAGTDDLQVVSDWQPLGLDAPPAVTAPALRLSGDLTPHSEVERGARLQTAYGVELVRTVPSRPKEGQLPFDLPALRAEVPLDGGDKTLGDLLRRVAGATGLDLVADKRVASLPVYVRTAPEGRGRSAPAGAVLRALCLSVTGAFRRLDGAPAGAGPTYLLTDDVEGIGPRFVRLAEWAEAAAEQRYRILDRVDAAAAARDPLSHVGFAPGSPLSLPPELLKRIDDAYRAERYARPAFPLAELPAPLREHALAMARIFAASEQNPMQVRTDRFQVLTQLSFQLIAPGVAAAVEAPFAQNFDHQWLQKVAAPEPRRSPGAVGAKAPAPALPDPLPTTGLRRRVLAVRLPEDDAATAALLKTAGAKGFTEVWLHVPLADPKASASRLAAAVAAGRRAGVAVGAAVSLLRGEGALPGLPEDVTLTGETGAEMARRRGAANPSWGEHYGNALAGWREPPTDPALVTSRLLPLARGPGLSALALKATAGPGWAGAVRGGDGIPSNGHLGYSPAVRLAGVRAAGLDPIDVPAYGHSLDADASLPFFPARGGDRMPDGFWGEVARFRGGKSAKLLGAAHAALRKAAPALPLFLDDRASPYTSVYTSWFGRWERGDKMPENHPFAVESEGRVRAFEASPEPLLSLPGRKGRDAADSARAAVAGAARAIQERWPGMVLDFSGLEPADALRQLKGFAAAAPAARRR